MNEQGNKKELKFDFSDWAVAGGIEEHGSIDNLCSHYYERYKEGRDKIVDVCELITEPGLMDALDCKDYANIIDDHIIDGDRYVRSMHHNGITNYKIDWGQEECLMILWQLRVVRELYMLTWMCSGFSGSVIEEWAQSVRESANLVLFYYKGEYSSSELSPPDL